MIRADTDSVVTFPTPSAPLDTKTAEYAKSFTSSNHKRLQATPCATAVKTAYGISLFASRDIEPNEVVEWFEGPDVDYDSLTDYDKMYALNYYRMGEWRWLLPLSNARYCDHKCTPNVMLTDELEVVTVVAVKKGALFGFVYNHGSKEDFWDPLWSFKCYCKSSNCQQSVDGYRADLGVSFTSPKGYQSKLDMELPHFEH